MLFEKGDKVAHYYEIWEVSHWIPMVNPNTGFYEDDKRIYYLENKEKDIDTSVDYSEVFPLTPAIENLVHSFQSVFKRIKKVSKGIQNINLFAVEEYLNDVFCSAANATVLGDERTLATILKLNLIEFSIEFIKSVEEMRDKQVHGIFVLNLKRE